MAGLSDKTAGTISCQIQRGDTKAFLNTFNQIYNANKSNFLYLGKKGDIQKGREACAYAAIQKYTGEKVREKYDAQFKEQKEKITENFLNSLKKADEKYDSFKKEGNDIYKSEMQKWKDERNENIKSLEKKETMLGIVALVSVFTGVGLIAAIPLAIKYSSIESKLDGFKESYKNDYKEASELAGIKRDEFMQPHKEDYDKEIKEIKAEKKEQIEQLKKDNNDKEKKEYHIELNKMKAEYNDFIRKL